MEIAWGFFANNKDTIFHGIIAIGSAIIFFFTLFPTIKFWNIIAHSDNFKSRCEVLIFTLCRILFTFSIVVFSFNLAVQSRTCPSYFMLLFSFQLLFFPVISLWISLVNGIVWILLKCTHKHLKKQQHKKWLERFFGFKQYPELDSFLSHEWVKMTLVVIYLISGIITATDVANTYIPIVSKHYNTVICSNDLQLYSNIFIVTLIPAFLSFFTRERNSASQEGHDGRKKS